jgi:hypothetical protein
VKRFKRAFLASGICLLAVLLPACAPVAAPTAASTAPPMAQSAAPTATAIRTPPELPESFVSTHLNPLDQPRPYIEDACRYLHDKWSPEKSAPGTVVMIVMLNSINRGSVPESPDAITLHAFDRMMEELHAQQFEAITAQQLADFLEHNALVPQRSVVLVQDGRRLAEHFNKHFRPYWEKWRWPVVNAWEMLAEAPEALWEESLALEKEGWVDHQVYGMQVTATVENYSEGYLMDQFRKPFAAFRERFGKVPLAIVWPSGFGVRSVQAARQTGYRLGFTFNARGPVMFNWVPQADQSDGLRPSYAPEISANDPLMTLPRYWPYQVRDALDSVRTTGKEAAAHAEQNRAVELEYYEIVCAAEYGPISQ